MLDKYIKQRFSSLYKEDKYISKDELLNLVDEDKKYIIIICEDDNIVSFSNVEKAQDYVDDLDNDCIKIRQIMPSSYYASIITKELRNSTNISDQKIMEMIQTFYEKISTSDEELGCFESAFYKIESGEDLIDEFKNNQDFSDVILCQYVFDVVETEKHKNELAKQIEEITIFSDQVEIKLEEMFKNLIYKDKYFFASILIDNTSCPFVDEDIQKIFSCLAPQTIAEYIVKDKFTRQTYIEQFLKQKKNKVQIHTINQISRELLEEIYVSLAITNNSENTFDIIGKYLISNVRLSKTKFRELFIQNSNLEQEIKQLAINLILMDYTRVATNNRNKKFILENDITACMKEFYLNDEFRFNTIAKYFKSDNLVNECVEDEKYLTLSKLDQI